MATFIQLHRAWLPKFLLLWIMLMAFLGRYVYVDMDADNKVRRKEVLVSLCDQRARMLQDQFNVSVNNVHALAILLSTFHYYRNSSTIDQETFAKYTARTAFERPLLNEVAYAQRVVSSDREIFERKHGWVIKTKEKEPSPVRDEYAPVIFAQETVSYLKSIDMMSGEEDRENILRARATGKAVLTSPFRPLGSHHLGMVLTFPVYKSKLSSKPTVEERVQATAGYVGGSFDIESIVENLLGQTMLVHVFDVTNSTDPLTMYGNPYEEGDVSLQHVSKLDFGDSLWKSQMICWFRQKAPTSWTALTTAFLLFMIGLLAGYILYDATIHIVKVEDDFHEMQELKVRAEAADVAKSQFLANVTHQIRTPMNGILGMLHMLVDTKLSSAQRDRAQNAQVCGKAQVELINQILDRTKVEAKAEACKLELEAFPFDIRSILDDTLSLFFEESRRKGIELAVFVSGKVPDIVMGDPGRFKEIITNLVGNSLEHTGQGHIFVNVYLAENIKTTLTMNGKPQTFLNGGSDEVMRISSGYKHKTLSGCEAADKRNSWDNFQHLIADEEFCFDASSKKVISTENSDQVTLVVCVEDTGIGISLSAQDRIFMPSVQSDSSTSRNYSVTDNGLSISKCLVELMGGHINLVSRPHVGSTFSFTAVFRTFKKSLFSHAINLNFEHLPSGFRGMKAVVVDEKLVRAAVTMYHLRRLEKMVKATNSINKTVDLCGQNVSLTSGMFQPDIIFVEKDSWLSGDNAGFNISLMDWKQNGHMWKLPKMILLATNISNAELDKAKAAGFADTVINKPLRASTVATCLRKVLGMGKKRQLRKKMPINSTYPSRQMKILVVDDNAVNRSVIARVLKTYFGADVKCAENGKGALEMLQLPHDFDICFMDIQMPEMDGFEATRRIRQMESKLNEQTNGGAVEVNGEKIEWHVPILAMTADVIQTTYDECLKCGMDGCVSKPFEENNLFQEVAKFLKPDHLTSLESRLLRGYPL